MIPSLSPLPRIPGGEGQGEGGRVDRCAQSQSRPWSLPVRYACTAIRYNGIRFGSAASATEDINYGRRSKAAVRLLPPALHEKARIKLARLHAAESLNDLATLPGSRLEKLLGDRAGQYSIRLNDPYRICFRWSSQGADDVEIVDYH
jgi:toxin HigB-1